MWQVPTGCNHWDSICYLEYHNKLDAALLVSLTEAKSFSWRGSVVMHAGLLGDAVASTLDGAALMIAAGAGALAAGVPITVMPAPLLAAGGLAMYLDTDALRDYLLFVAGVLGTGGQSAAC
jgi:hypothetical protein